MAKNSPSANKHKCYIYREIFEEDCGIGFCDMYGILYSRGRRSNESSDCSTPYTPNVTTRSRNPETVERQENRRLRSEIFRLLEDIFIYENDILRNLFYH